MPQPLSEAQRANLRRVRISPILVRFPRNGKVPTGPGDMRVLRGLEARGLVVVQATMAGLAFHLTEEGEKAEKGEK
jgi:hypothetical protein